MFATNHAMKFIFIKLPGIYSTELCIVREREAKTGNQFLFLFFVNLE